MQKHILAGSNSHRLFFREIIFYVGCDNFGLFEIKLHNIRSPQQSGDLVF